MNRSAPTPDDRADRLLAAYFKAQLPAAWPAPPIPVQASTRPLAGVGQTWRTRLTLGACAAGLLGLGLMLSGSPTGTNSNDPRDDGFLKSGTANGKSLVDKARNTAK